MIITVQTQREIILKNPKNFDLNHLNDHQILICSDIFKQKIIMFEGVKEVHLCSPVMQYSFKRSPWISSPSWSGTNVSASLFDPPAFFEALKVTYPRYFTELGVYCWTVVNNAA